VKLNPPFSCVFLWDIGTVFLYQSTRRHIPYLRLWESQTSHRMLSSFHRAPTKYTPGNIHFRRQNRVLFSFWIQAIFVG